MRGVLVTMAVIAAGVAIAQFDTTAGLVLLIAGGLAGAVLTWIELS